MFHSASKTLYFHKNKLYTYFASTLAFLDNFQSILPSSRPAKRKVFFKKKTNKNNLISDLLHQPVKDSFLTALILHCGVTIL